jgi:ABC-type nitrate/sulfonate/bicarbonate transport system substrate-binding protein
LPRKGFGSLGQDSPPPIFLCGFAHEKGFMKKYGLDPDVIFFGASPTATQALLAGELDIVVASVPAVVNARLGGADTVLFLTFVPTFVDHVISAPTITRVQELKGKIGGVNRLFTFWVAQISFNGSPSMTMRSATSLAQLCRNPYPS